MTSLKIIFIIFSSILTLVSCTDEKIIVAPAVKSVQTCTADFVQDIEFRYIITHFFNGDSFVSCELTDFELNKSVSSGRFYSRDSLSSAAVRLECSLFHEVTPSVLAGEFVFDVVNNTPGMTIFNEFSPPETIYAYSLSEECVFESF